ncbi:flagellar basal body P-ring formation chaperone FlgA [Sporohalobacter salinus]|uniref:flagellar basal body P-ring formation chaperone FlgA n=1 Tax=Sporohalobacter salinus TaxID=1494606 RepID=UPI0019617CE4|nr:flagellar basal body P-ring formation chaperone FlgA [Sporohalobacter salinus]MBM7622909.1 flagella basal body P-ring formation protein FlgA [Sporohalobacter salinus]
MVNWRQLPLFKLTFLLLILLLLISSTGFAQDKIKLEINHKVKAEKQSLHLGDIAKIEAPLKLKEQLSTINLGQAPLPGYTRVLKRDYILSALQREGFNSNKISYKIPKQIRVTTPYQVLDREQLEKKVQQYIKQNLAVGSEDIEIEIQKTDKEVRLPVGKVKLQIGNVNTKKLLGRIAIPVNIYVDGKLAKKKYVQAQITAYQKVLVAKESIERRQSLAKDLFKWEKRELAKLYGNQPFTNLDSLSNYRLERRINSGQILTKNLIEIPPLVKRRDKIKIVAEVGQVRVSTVGVALESGAEGDIIKVRNIKSDQEIMAKVIEKKVVKAIL